MGCIFCYEIDEHGGYIVKKKLLFAATIMLLSSFITGCSRNLYESNASGYTQVTSVEGVYFDMADSWLEQATAITHIAEENDYSVGTYLYKDGESSYLLFDIASIIVCVEKNTDFNFANADSIEAALTSTSLDGIWFTAANEKLKYDTCKRNGAYKLIANVNAEVSVTSELYGNFSGKLASISNDGYEYSLFIGAKADSFDELTKTQLKLINHICKSLTFSTNGNDSNNADDTEYNSIIQGSEASSSESISNATSEPEKSETEREESPKIERGSETEEFVTITDNSDNTDNSENSNNSAKADSSTEFDEKKTLNSNIPESTVTSSSESADDFTSLKNNQSKAESQFSDIYHMLKIGDTGTFQTLNSDASQFEAEDITINALYTGDDAIKLIKEYCSSTDCPYEYEDAPAGTKWHVIEYTLDRAPTDLYANIKLIGLDGEKLKYRGVSYTTRTHDIFYSMETSNGKYAKLYCYYAVPNGCTEYALQIGEQLEDANAKAAYFMISNY